MKNIIICMLLAFIIWLCGRMPTGSSEDATLKITVTDSFWTNIIYCDSYSVDENGKYQFFDKQGKYVGECFVNKGFSIERINY